MEVIIAVTLSVTELPGRLEQHCWPGGERNCAVNKKGHRSDPQQQFMCGSLKKRAFKWYRGWNSSCMYSYLRGKGEENKNSLLDSLLVKVFSCRTETSSVLRVTNNSQLITVITTCTPFRSSPLLVQFSGPHSEDAGYYSNFNMAQCWLTGKIGCDLLRIGSI